MIYVFNFFHNLWNLTKDFKLYFNQKTWVLPSVCLIFIVYRNQPKSTNCCSTIKHEHHFICNVLHATTDKISCKFLINYTSAWQSENGRFSLYPSYEFWMEYAGVTIWLVGCWLLVDVKKKFVEWTMFNFLWTVIKPSTHDQ